MRFSEADSPDTSFLDVHHVAHGYLDGEGDELFHFLRGQRGRDGDNLHLIVGDVGYGIDGQCQHGVDAARQEQQRGQGHEELLSDGEMYDFCKHIGFRIKFSVGQN